jgi:hypothetical protein
MIDEPCVFVPMAPKPPIQVIVPPAEAQIPAPPVPNEHIRAVDHAFVSEQEKIDSTAALIGLWLTSPWLGDVIADHFRKPSDDEEEEVKPHPALGEQE